MCLGIPGRVVSMVEGYSDQLALVDVEGAARKVNIGLLDAPPTPGQWVLIHMGFAVETTDADGAQSAMSGLELMGRARDRPGPGPVDERAAIEALFGSLHEPLAEPLAERVGEEVAEP